MSPMAKMPGSEVWNFSVSTLITFSSSFRPQSATGPSLMVSPKNGSSRVACDHRRSPRHRLARSRRKLPVVAFELRDLPELKLILPLVTSSRILLTDVGAALNSSRRCTSVSRLRDRLQVERPVERAIAAADDHHVLVAEASILRTA